MRLTRRRINLEDLKGAPEWVPPLVATLNLANEDVERLVNGRLTLAENISGAFFTSTIRTPANYATGGFTPFAFAFTGDRPSACVIANLVATSPAEPILTATSLSWSYNPNVDPAQVKVTYVAGLKPNQTYSITVMVL